jgi:lipopolysaccharide/colanic/teichoic acid biosynthesis glycosyltransferase
MALLARRTVVATKIDTLVTETLFAAPKAGLYRDGFKRALDVVIVLMCILPVLTIIGCLAVIISFDGKSPFYVQERVGRNGRVLRMWKLRSMVVDADERLKSYLEANPAARAEWDHAQKLRNDPRITRIGHLIRKTSLDELPQLFNGLKGDMALVGPRPMMVSQQELYPGSAYSCAPE